MSTGWTLRNSYAGQTETIEGVEPRWRQTLGAPGPTSVTLTFRSTLDLRSLARRYKPSTGFAVLSRNDKAELAGFWSAVRWKPVSGGAVVEVTIAPSSAVDHGVFPPVSGFRPDLSYKVGTGQDLTGAAAFRAMYGTLEGYEETNTYIAEGRKIVSSVFPNLADQARDRSWPWVYGAPGDATSTGSPAYMVDATAGSEEIMIAGHRVTASTVTIWGPSATAYNDAYTDAAGLGSVRSAAGNAAAAAAPYVSDAGVPVRHKVTSSGSVYAYVLGDDLTNVEPLPQLALYASWTGGDAQPGRAGDLLYEILGLATVTIDMVELRRLSHFLNRYRLDGYTDRRQPPTEFVESVLAPILPLSLVPSAAGLRPILAAWVDDGPRATGFRIIDGASIVTDSGIEYADSVDEVASVTLEYGYRPKSAATTFEVSADATTTATRRDSGGAVGSERLVTYSVWDHATAAVIVRDQYAARTWAPTLVRCTVADMSDHDTGGLRPFTLGARVLLTSDRLGLTDEPGSIQEVERDGVALMVAVYLDDDPHLPR